MAVTGHPLGANGHVWHVGNMSFVLSEVDAFGMGLPIVKMFTIVGGSLHFLEDKCDGLFAVTTFSFPA